MVFHRRSHRKKQYTVFACRRTSLINYIPFFGDNFLWLHQRTLFRQNDQQSHNEKANERTRHSLSYSVRKRSIRLRTFIQIKCRLTLLDTIDIRMSSLSWPQFVRRDCSCQGSLSHQADATNWWPCTISLIYYYCDWPKLLLWHLLHIPYTFPIHSLQDENMVNSLQLLDTQTLCWIKSYQFTTITNKSTWWPTSNIELASSVPGVVYKS